MVLTRSEAKAYYDHFGKKQDSQSFYEDPAVDAMIAHAAFEDAESLLEFGCGTGRLAERLLADCLPPAATYVGIDQSGTMVDLASQRLASFGARARIERTDGAPRFPIPDASVDRVVSTYVLDLLSESDARGAIAEARRVLRPGGLLALVSLTKGFTPASRFVTAIWSVLFRFRAKLVGGCRPIRIAVLLDTAEWIIEYHHEVSRFGVPSEVVVARKRSEA